MIISHLMREDKVTNSDLINKFSLYFLSMMVIGYFFIYYLHI